MTGAARALYGVQSPTDDLLQDVLRALCCSRPALAPTASTSKRSLPAPAQRRARFAEVPVIFSAALSKKVKFRAFDAVRVMRELIRCKLVANTTMRARG